MTAFPIILSAPSGGGKTTIARKLLEHRTDLGYSVSCTTRLPRPGEIDGKHYHFLTLGEFADRRDRGELAEWAEVHGRLYGTLRREVESVLATGRHVMMDIDVQGAEQFVKSFPESVTVFVLPPSAEVLLTRLLQRRTEDQASLIRRLQSAREELDAVGRYNYVVVNDVLERAVNSVSSIIDAEMVRHDRVRALDEQVQELIAQLEGAIREQSNIRV